MVWRARAARWDSLIRSIRRPPFERAPRAPFSRVTVVAAAATMPASSGSTASLPPNNGITPAFNLDHWPAIVSAAAADQSLVQNNTNVDYWNGQDATRAPESLQLDILDSARRYRAALFSRPTTMPRSGRICRSGIENINQVPMSTFNALISAVRTLRRRSRCSIRVSRRLRRWRREFRFHIRISPTRACSGLMTRQPGAAAISAISDHRHQPKRRR